MASYTVDVKAFLSVTVEATDEAHARRLADDDARGTSPVAGYVEGYNETLAKEGETGRIDDDFGWSVDGESDVLRDYLADHDADPAAEGETCDEPRDYADDRYGEGDGMHDPA